MPIAPLAIVTVAASLIAIAACCLAAAILPGRDPLNLPERRRTVYVYTAEGALDVLQPDVALVGLGESSQHALELMRAVGLEV